VLDLPGRRVVRQEHRGIRTHRGEEVECHRLEVAVQGRRRSGGLLDRRERPPNRLVQDVELWIGDDARIRLAALSLRFLDPLSPANSALLRDLRSMVGIGDRPLWRTVELFSFGVDATIRVPRADELVRDRLTLADVRLAGELASHGWRHRREIWRYLRRG
jgi:hypothetical protein